MTAIVGYINRKENESIGVLSADDLEVSSQCKVDKLSKLSNRFVIGIIGLETVQWVIRYAFEYLEYYNGSSEKISSIEDLETKLSERIPIILSEWADAGIIKNRSEQLEIDSELVVLDLKENKLYYADLGKVWKIHNPLNYKVEFTSLPDGLYTFGIAVGDISKSYNREEGHFFSKEEALSLLKEKFQKYKLENVGFVGDIGATEINVVGESLHESFSSCFSSYREIIDNMIKRENAIRST